MPELPEVETVVRELKEALPGKIIKTVDVLWPKTWVARTDRPITGQRIERITRKGKYILVHLNDSVLVIHLRMTGQLLLANANAKADSKHLRCRIVFTDGSELLFNDQRKFGRMYHTETPDGILSKIGKDAFDPYCTVDWFVKQVSARRTGIKSLLLSQSVIAGLGNIYADESLFRAGIHPASVCQAVPVPRLKRLFDEIQYVLKFAVSHMGSTISDYRDAYGNVGETQKFFQVYQQQGKPCPNCGNEIQKIRVANRGTHVCPHCQILYR